MEKYDLQNAILREAAKPASERAVVSIEKPAVEYAASKAASDAATVNNSMKLAQNEKQFLAQLMTAHDQLKTFSKQNDIATIIAAAGVPAQMAANSKMSDSMDKQNAMTRELIDIQKANVTKQNLADAAQIKKINDFINPPPPLVPNSPLLVSDPAIDLSVAAKLLNRTTQPLDYRR